MKKLTVFLCLFSLVIFIKGQDVESFVASDGETLYFTTKGSGPKIFLFTGGPGYAANTLMYWVDSLSNEFECVLFDLRGTGNAANVRLDSSTVNMNRAVNDIDDLRKHLNLEKITLCGISFGGALAQCYAANYPEHTKNLVLVSTMGPDYSLDRPFIDNLWMRFHPLEKDSVKYWEKHDDKKLAYKNINMLWLKHYFYNHEFAGKLLPSFIEKNIFYPKMSYLMTRDLKHNFDIKDKLRNYDGPCTIFRPRQDPIPEQTIYIIKDILPKTKIRYIEKCGHFPGIERPDIFFRELKNTL